jgi:uncharacterized protein (DUF2147 family)
MQDEYGELRAALTAVQTEAADAAAAAAAEALAAKKKHDVRLHVRSLTPCKAATCLRVWHTARGACTR